MLVRHTMVGWLMAASTCWQCSHAPIDVMPLHTSLPKLHEVALRQTGLQLDDPTEWIVVENPPERVPVPLLLPAESQHQAADQGQQGVLVMYHWLIEGEPISSEVEPPFLWPSPQSIIGDSIVIDLGTGIAPIEVETRVFRSVDESGLPVTPSPAIWCKYLESDADCKITRESDEESWKIVLRLPGYDTYFVSLRGVWGFPIDPDASDDVAFTDIDAGWLFAVNND